VTNVRRQLSQVLLLAGLTWREGIRRRMLYVGFGLTAAFIALYGLGVYFAFRHWERDMGGFGGGDMGPMGGQPAAVMRDLAAYNMLSLALFLSTFLGAMLVVFLASGMVSGDAENGTLQTIVTRPVARRQIVLGRYLGYASVYLVYMAILCASLLIATRVFAGYSPASPVEAIALLSVQGLILLALTATTTVLLSPMATGIMVMMAFGLAFVGGVVQQIGGFLRNHTAEQIGGAVGYLVPTDTFFRMGLSGLEPRGGGLITTVNMGPFGQPTTPTLGLILYGLLYLAAFLILSLRLFARRDL